MIGYHYTSWENWVGIRSQGMRPQWITEEGIRVVSKNTKGIWLYQSRLESEELLGMLLSVLGTKRCSCACELEVSYQSPERIQAHAIEDELCLSFSAAIGDWNFIQDKPIVITKEYIPVNKVMLRRTWSLDQVIIDAWHYENKFSCCRYIDENETKN